MARRPRIFGSGLLYHVIVRGNHRQPTFLTDRDYRAYEARLARYRARDGAQLWAYCLMPNHVHLLLQTGTVSLARTMQSLQQTYTQYFNRTHEKVGHLFQGRYKAIVCEQESYLLALIRYVHLNPVRAHLVPRPEAYRYSGHGVYLAGRATAVLDPSPGLAAFGGPRAYARFVEARLPEGHQADFYAVQAQQVLGSEAFMEQLRPPEDVTTLRRPRHLLGKSSQVLARQVGRRVEELTGPDRSWAVTRDRAHVTYVLVRQGGYGVSAVARALKRDPATISTMLSRWGARLQRDPRLRQAIERLTNSV